MRISEICIKRPVFATVLSIVLTLIGVVSYSRITVREYPNIDEPVVSVRTNYSGASAEIIESQDDRADRRGNQQPLQKVGQQMDMFARIPTE